MKKSTVLRPVSQKAYAGFIERISLIIHDSSKCIAMLAALDRYLEGDRDTYTSGLTLDCVMAFEMLRFDIDLAIARSEKARMRARKSKTSSVNQTPAVTINKDDAERPVMAESPSVEDADADDEPAAFIPPISRRQRRALTRYARPKARWRKL